MTPENITQPQIYLDLGEALAAFGIIFAVYQLRKSQWDIVLNIRNRLQRNLFWIMSALGLLFTLLRILLPKLFEINYWMFPFNNPLFYEIAAYMSFIISPISLIWFSSRTKGLFNEKTAKKFYEVLVKEISKSNIEGANAALEVLLNNFIEICKIARANNKDDQIWKSANALLDVILSDELIVKLLTTKRLDALQFILNVIEKNDISRNESGIGIPIIIQNLFYDKDSFFYKHLDREGLALSSNIYSSIFESPIILTNFAIFGYPTLNYLLRKEIGITGNKVFIEALSRAIKTYLKTGTVPARRINEGLSYLSDILSDLCLKINIEQGRGVDTKYILDDEWWAIHEIIRFIGHDYLFLGNVEKLNEAVMEKERRTIEADFYSDSTINAGIAAVLYKAFEHLSFVDENTLAERLYILDLLKGMAIENNYKEGYIKPFEKRIWEQIAANIIYRHYPAVLRTYLLFFSNRLSSDQGQAQGWVGEQTEKIRRLLYIDLKPLLEKDEEMINKEKMKDALLPKSVSYKNGNFFYKFTLIESEDKMITAPPEGSKSALDDIDLAHHSLL